MREHFVKKFRKCNIFTELLIILNRSSERPLGFIPEIFVQGILLQKGKKENWKSMIPIHGILAGRFPITIINLQQRSVR